MKTALAVAPFVVVLMAFEVYCIVTILRSEAKVLPRPLWLLITVASVPLGGILYLSFGRGAMRRPDGVGSGASPGSGTGSASERGPRPVSRADHVDDVDDVVTTKAAIVTLDMRKSYGATRALDGVSLAVPPGSVFGLVGPNGAGKTTLLATLAGLRDPDEGSYSFGEGHPQVALLPDTPQFEAWLTAREVVELARALAAPATRPDRTAEVLAITGLADAADRRTGGFSRGMLQRLGLAATIVGDPDVLLLDEPCSALDPIGRREVLDLIGRLAGRHTVLFCSHILDDVQEVCDTVGILRAGRLLFQGPLDDLLIGAAAPGYTIRVRGSAGSLAAALAREAWVRDVSRIGTEVVEVTVTSLADAERGLAPALAAAGAPLVSVVPAGADLEKVFLELTR